MPRSNKTPAEATLATPMRKYLSTLTPGTLRTLRRWGRENPVGVTYTQLERAVVQGYLRIAENTPERWNGSAYEGGTKYERTEKPCVSRTRPPNPNYGKVNPFPWPVELHWTKMEGAPWRALRSIAKQLSAKDTAGMDRSNTWQENRKTEIRMQRRFPSFVKTKAMLADTRGTLLYLFGGIMKTSKRYGGETIPWSEPADFMMNTGESLRLIMLELLIEPEFVDDKFVRFVEVNGEKAWDEADRIMSRTDDAKTKYLNYRRLREPTN